MKSVALTVLDLLAFNAQKFRGSRDPGHAPFWENFKGSYADFTLETRTSNLKSVALAVLVLLAFNGQNLGGHVTMATPVSGAAQKYFLRDVRGKLCSKFGEDMLKTGLTVLAVVAGGRTPDGRTGGRMDGRTLK